MVKSIDMQKVITIYEQLNIVTRDLAMKKMLKIIKKSV